MNTKLYLFLSGLLAFLPVVYAEEANKQQPQELPSQEQTENSSQNTFHEFVKYLESPEGEKMRVALTSLYHQVISDVGTSVGRGIEGAFSNASKNIAQTVGLSAEELIKGLMRGLTDPKTTKEFTKEFNKIFAEFGKEGTKTTSEIITNGRKMFFDQLAASHKEYQKEFGNGGRARTEMKESAKVTIDATREFATDVTDGVKQTFGKDSQAYKNVDIVSSDFMDLIRKNFNTIQKTLLTDTGKYAGYGLAAVAGGFLIPRFTIEYIYRYFISKLNDPRIIIETSIGSWPYEYAKWIFRFRPTRAAEKLEDMVLSAQVKERIIEIINFEKAHRKHKEGFDNILLVGHPGTGKTMFAKAIAAELGMDYIVVTGSSFFQDNAGVKAIDQIFGKLTRGRKVVIFIDEIDSIASSRVGKNVDSDAYRLLNQLLNYTSTPNQNFILIGATNHPETIDKAFYRRFQHVVQMPLPEMAERIAFLKFAVEKQLVGKVNKSQKGNITTLFDAVLIQELAEKTASLSYAELQTIIDHVKVAMRLSGLTKEMIYKATEQVKQKESSFKQSFLK